MCPSTIFISVHPRASAVPSESTLSDRRELPLAYARGYGGMNVKQNQDATMMEPESALIVRSRICDNFEYKP
jgi:hypothetical protein